ncbi:MAG TPA: class I lanthipeptide [Thermoanaerobaculia bacterium]|nr:class I lanthipeptide [Thermoanaerobaculia bacterium]
MKKKAKKLTLAKETVRMLTRPELGQAMGADPRSTQCMTGDCPTAETPCELTIGGETEGC